MSEELNTLVQVIELYGKGVGALGRAIKFTTKGAKTGVDYAKLKNMQRKMKLHYASEGKEFRLFKLNRMDGIRHGEIFDRRTEIPMPELGNDKIFPMKGLVKAIFDPSMKWQLVEEYGVDSFKEQPDGTLFFEHEYADDEGLISWTSRVIF